MARDWESTFSAWVKPPGKTETDRCENAIKAIRNAIDRSDKLNHRSTKVFVQGSYRNRVNVRKDSDVDVGVLCSDVFFDDYPAGTTRETFGNVDGDYHYPQYKNELEETPTPSLPGRSAPCLSSPLGYWLRSRSSGTTTARWH